MHKYAQICKNMQKYAFFKANMHKICIFIFRGVHIFAYDMQRGTLNFLFFIPALKKSLNSTIKNQLFFQNPFFFSTISGDPVHEKDCPP